MVTNMKDKNYVSMVTNIREIMFLWLRLAHLYNENKTEYKIVYTNHEVLYHMKYNLGRHF